MMNSFFIFDTNTLLSAVFNEHSTPAKALKMARLRGLLLVSDEIINEYLAVFSREKFDKWVSLQTRIDFIENIISNALCVEVIESITVCRDPKDNKFLSLASASQADCIVSGDDDLLILNPFKGVTILKPSEFLKFFDDSFMVHEPQTEYTSRL